MKIFLMLIYITLCSSPFVYGIETEKMCLEHIHFNFDERDWEKGFQDSNQETSITEFVLKGENVDSWTELVSVQKLIPIESTDIYYKEFIKQLKKAVAPSAVHSHIIQNSEGVLFFEWWILPPSPQAQHEWFKLFKTSEGTYVLRYTTKKMNTVEKARPIWEMILEKASINEEPCPEPEPKP